jgi:beta-mannosidase
VSEFGFESLPPMATISAFAPDPADWNLGSPLLDHHQRCPSGNARILFYLADQFRLPRDFSGLVYLSQVLQAEAMRVGVEHWRREDRCRGALYWQLNDCWPVSSWSSIDYYGRWKAMHFATRRFYDPVLLSARIDGDTAALSITNDRPGLWHGELRWSLEGLDGTILLAGGGPVEAAGVATTTVATVPVPGQADRRAVVLVSELLEAGSRRALVVTPFVPDKHLALRQPEIELAIEPAGVRVDVRVRSDTLARWVEISLEGAEPLFRDNFFDVPAGREVATSFEMPEGWDLSQIRGALRARSVVDTYS